MLMTYQLICLLPLFYADDCECAPYIRALPLICVLFSYVLVFSLRSLLIIRRSIYSLSDVGPPEQKKTSPGKIKNYVIMTFHRFVTLDFVFHVAWYARTTPLHMWLCLRKSLKNYLKLFLFWNVIFGRCQNKIRLHPNQNSLEARI